MQDNLNTPMIKQYLDVKKQYPDCLLMYRMGDFYELFFEDAHIGARVLNITLTGKANGKGGRIPMAGVPYHAVDSYLAKLVKAGYKVAICEQLSPPNKKDLVKRDVLRIVTPGTMLDEKALEKKENNYIVAVLVKKDNVAISVADISTGYFASSEFPSSNLKQIIQDEFARIKPKECILHPDLYNDTSILNQIKTDTVVNIFPFQDWEIYGHDALGTLKAHFGVATLAGVGLDGQKHALETAAALLGYLKQTQKGPVQHIQKISSFATSEYVGLDRSTIINLELFSTIREHDARGTLLSVLDQTITAMGGRLLKQWMQKPLTVQKEIMRRHDAVEELLKKQANRYELRDVIKEVSDIERLVSRCSVGLGNARDLVNLKSSLVAVVKIKDMMGKFESELIRNLAKRIKTSPVIPDKRHRNDIEKIIRLIDHNIVSEPPISIREGGMIRVGIENELDSLRKVVNGSRDWMVDLEKKEREATGIATLKIRYNQVFGFSIEVSKSHLNRIPQTYIRKQTLVNAERFITPELKEQEEIILTAEQKIHDREYAIFQKILTKVLEDIGIIQEAAQSIAAFDCLLTFAHLSETRNYTRPTFRKDGEIRITSGRHPVVETVLLDKQFVPNDVKLTQEQQLLLLTGPNMAGKSVYIRQTALLVLMSQMGCFIPAEKAELSIVDQIFVRSGASDVITSGLSTFMVEMVETAHILHHATDKSLIIMDEIGRGTSTYDGISIAWAVAEYLVSQKKNPKTLFATHYHEMQVLEEHFPEQIKNYHMSVADDQGEPAFLHTIVPGGSSHSFGVAVAKLAGIPEKVVKRAKELLVDLEKKSDKKLSQNDEVKFRSRQINLVDHLIHKELEQMDISQMTPLEALNNLANLKEKLKMFQLENKKFIEAD